MSKYIPKKYLVSARQCSFLLKREAPVRRTEKIRIGNINQQIFLYLFVSKSNISKIVIQPYSKSSSVMKSVIARRMPLADNSLKQFGIFPYVVTNTKESCSYSIIRQYIKHIWSNFWHATIIEGQIYRLFICRHTPNNASIEAL